MIVTLGFYVARTPGLFCQLTTDTMALRRFFGQVLDDGLLVLLATNFVGYFFDQFAIGKSARSAISYIWQILLADILVKLLAFVVFTAASYILHAKFADAFMGDPTLAIQAVAPTISGARFYENLTAVYLYAAALGSLPIFVVALLRLLAAYPRLSRAVVAVLTWLSLFENRPIRLLAVIRTSLEPEPETGILGDVKWITNKRRA
jgi:hypothetical protein